MMHPKSLSTPACLLAAILLTGCAQLPTFGSKEPPHRRPDAARDTRTKPAGPATPADPALADLHDGIEAFDNGDYNGAIKKLNTPDIARSTKANRLMAIKYTAFSYCVSGRPVPCRQQFDKALKLDPAFELDAGEAGHPLWGPVFARAKKAK